MVSGGLSARPALSRKANASAEPDLDAGLSHGRRDERPLLRHVRVLREHDRDVALLQEDVLALLLEKDRVRFADDLRANCRRVDVQSRYRGDDGRPLVETDVRVRSTIAWRKEKR